MASSQQGRDSQRWFPGRDKTEDLVLKILCLPTACVSSSRPNTGFGDGDLELRTAL